MTATPKAVPEIKFEDITAQEGSGGLEKGYHGRTAAVPALPKIEKNFNAHLI
jgi:hypothetical protein